MPTFRKRPIVIEARLSTGSPESNQEIIDWTRGSKTPGFEDGGMLWIATREGEMIVSPGDWIIRGQNNEFYPVKPDVFQQSYEAVSEPADERLDALVGE